MARIGVYYIIWDRSKPVYYVIVHRNYFYCYTKPAACKQFFAQSLAKHFGSRYPVLVEWVHSEHVKNHTNLSQVSQGLNWVGGSYRLFQKNLPLSYTLLELKIFLKLRASFTKNLLRSLNWFLWLDSGWDVSICVSC